VSTPPPSELRARIRTQVRTSRQRQGLGPHVTDAGLLGKLATRVLEPAEPIELPGAGEVGRRYAS
jgi:hypothetical protein